jgi:hypothetical protein
MTNGFLGGVTRGFSALKRLAAAVLARLHSGAVESDLKIQYSGSKCWDAA